MEWYKCTPQNTGPLYGSSKLKNVLVGSWIYVNRNAYSEKYSALEFIIVCWQAKNLKNIVFQKLHFTLTQISDAHNVILLCHITVIFIITRGKKYDWASVYRTRS